MDPDYSRQYKIKIPCTECHRAEPGQKCIFCDGTKAAGIAHFRRADYVIALESLAAAGTPVLEKYEEKLVDGKWVRQ
jgi:hypothetical protein